jgi:cell division GTPase FtsZ
MTNKRTKCRAVLLLKFLVLVAVAVTLLNTWCKAICMVLNLSVANTDMQALGKMSSPTSVQLGAELTRGLGAGTNPEVGRQAALETREQIVRALKGADMAFITAGHGWRYRYRCCPCHC